MKKGEKLLLVLGALLIAAGVFVGVTLGWDYSPNNYAYNEIDSPPPTQRPASAAS